MTLLEQVLAESKRLAPLSKRNYLSALRQYHEHAAGECTPAALQRWVQHLERRYKPSTVNARLAAVKYVSRRAAEVYGQEDFARPIEFIAQDTELTRRAIPVEWARALVAAAHGPLPVDYRDRALLALGFKIGCRRAGLCRMDVSDVELYGALPAVTVVLKARPGRPPLRHRTLLPREAREAVAQYLAVDPHDSGPLFRSFRVDGVTPLGRMTWQHLHEALKARGRRAGMGDFSAHVMRHSFISWGLGQGMTKTRLKSVTGQVSDRTIHLYETDVSAEVSAAGDDLPGLF